MLKWQGHILSDQATVNVHRRRSTPSVALAGEVFSAIRGDGEPVNTATLAFLRYNRVEFLAAREGQPLQPHSPPCIQTETHQHLVPVPSASHPLVNINAAAPRTNPASPVRLFISGRLPSRTFYPCLCAFFPHILLIVVYKPPFGGGV